MKENLNLFLQSSEEKEKSALDHVMASYVAFRCGRLELQEFCEQAYEQVGEEAGMEADLFRFQLAMLGGRQEETDNRRAQLLEVKPWEEGGFVESYYYYLKALDEKNPLTTQSSLEVIRANAGTDTGHRQYYVWMMIYLDAEITFSLKKQMELIRGAAMDEELLPLLKYEIISIWNRNPMLLGEADAFTADAMRFGRREGIVSKEVCVRFARVARRAGEPEEGIFALLEDIYEEYPEDEFLLSICRILLQSGHCCVQHHRYIKEAVQRSIRQKGLFEAYIRTMDWNTFEPVDLPVIQYFTYSSSLSADENAYLYTNLCRNEALYGQIVRSYQPKIEMFVMDSVRQGLINDRYAFLYQRYLPKLIQEKRILPVLPNVIFKKKLCCEDRKMQTAVIRHMEKEQADVYELQEGTAYCDIYSDRFTVGFYDKEGTECPDEVSWKMEAVLDEARYYQICREHGVVHEKMLIREAGDFRKKTSFEQEDIRTALRMQDSQAISGELKEMILELLLDYYYKNREYSALESLLQQVRWDRIQEKNRISVIEYFISRDFYDEAVRGMERYGYQEVKPELRKKAAFYLIDQLNGMKSAFTAKVCESLFLDQVYDKKILCYLQQHIPLEADYYIDLWKKGMECGIFDRKYTEYMIVKAAENQALTEDMQTIFLEYTKQFEGNETLSHYILEEFGKQYFADGKHYQEEFAAYLMQFMQTYGWENIHYPLSWLHSISKKGSLSGQEEELAEKVIEYFVDHEIYLAFFLRFDGRISLPQKLYCMSFVTYRGRTGCRVDMHCQTGRQGIIWEMPMAEILSGIYIGYFRPFIDEHPDVYVTVEGDGKKYRKSVTIESGAMKGKGLKYHKINEMLSMIHSDKVYDLMEQFEKTEFLIGKSLEPWL